ncbi:hypothetical protein OUZ56_028488 [Daphnia magna]|uniref:Uncharacterized protein n=1 Tax=Daphnia magna TaxID=35525 RepID=A0ABR0B412_9CRUS|nr:hypothetical protein OUZ56_028488 [Daphnia magna]
MRKNETMSGLPRIARESPTTGCNMARPVSNGRLAGINENKKIKSMLVNKQSVTLCGAYDRGVG